MVHPSGDDAGWSPEGRDAKVDSALFIPSLRCTPDGQGRALPGLSPGDRSLHLERRQTVPPMQYHLVGTVRCADRRTEAAGDSMFLVRRPIPAPHRRRHGT